MEIECHYGNWMSYFWISFRNEVEKLKEKTARQMEDYAIFQRFNAAFLSLKR